MWLITLGGCAVRLAVALTDDGLIYPDEVFQSLEQAHRVLFGAGFVPWEFQVGARPWVLPGLLMAPMALTGGALGPRVMLALLSGLTAWACARLARSLGGSGTAELLAASFWALLNLGVLLGSRALGESACTLPLVLGLALAVKREATVREVVIGSALVALAVMLRLQVGVMALCLPGIWWWRGQRRLAVASLLTLSAGAALLAGLDWLTWGSPLQSVREYLRFNWVEGRASQFGTQPLSYYPGRLFASLQLVMLLGSALALLGARRAVPVAVMTAAFITVHLAIAHKELRFLLPVLPLGGVLTALGVDALREWKPQLGWAGAAAVVLALMLQPRVTSLSWSQLGISHATPDDAAFDDGGPETRLLRAAGRLREVCGVELLEREVDSSGGYSALHRALPLFDASHPPANSASVNAVIATRGTREGRELAVEGEHALVLLREGCAPAPDFQANWPLLF